MTPAPETARYTMAFLHDTDCGNVGEMYVETLPLEVTPGSTKLSPIAILFSERPISVMVGVVTGTPPPKLTSTSTVNVL